MGKPTNLTGLTSLRGIAAILVMLHNYTLTFYPDIQKFSSTSFLEKSYLWVDMFFLLSGFVLSHVYHGTFRFSINYHAFKNFSLARFARIYPLHIFLLGFLIVLEFLCHFLGGSSDVRSTNTILENIFLLQVFNPYTYWNEPSWSISAEWLTYIFVPFIILLAFKLNRAVRLLTILACIAGLYAIELSFGDFGIRHSGWSLYVRCVLEVIIGVNVYNIYLENKIASKYFKVIIPIVFLAILGSMAITLTHTITILLFIVLIYVVAHLNDKDAHWLNNRGLVWLGTISYSIYLIHDPVKQTLVAVSTWIDIPINGVTVGYYTQVFITIICAALSVILAHFSYLLIEEPSRKRIRNTLSPVNSAVT